MNKLFSIIAMLVIGAIIGYVIKTAVFSQTTNVDDDQQKEERKVAYWVAPMDPHYRRGEPGKSPMGMDLVPVYAEASQNSGSSDEVRLSPSVINNLGVRTAVVQEDNFQLIIESVWFIDYDESKISHVHLRTEGWIEKRFVNSVGERVQKGDKLFDVYSPELINAQSDYLSALQTDRETLIRASKDRLVALGIPMATIKDLERSRKIKQTITYFASQDGIVSALNIADGMHVTAKTTMLSLADLSTVWLVVDVFETQVSQIKEGLLAEVRLSYQPDDLWRGQITYIYPQIDPKTRTLKVRLVFDNPDELLKPAMYADVKIFADNKPDALSIPREALIRTGNSERVILALDEGRFRPAEVISGIESGERVEILDGLHAGEKIVISAQFLIDSEASFTGTMTRMLGDTQNRELEKNKALTLDKKRELKDSVANLSGDTYYKVTGILREVKSGGLKVRVSHDPVPGLGWPAMTMDFDVDTELSITLPVETEIIFTIEKREENSYTIIDMEAQQ